MTHENLSWHPWGGKLNYIFGSFYDNIKLSIEGSETVEQTETTIITETKEGRFDRPYLFLHATNIPRAEFIKQHGLFGRSEDPTLTNSLELVNQYAQTGQERHEISTSLSRSTMDEAEQSRILDYLDQATRILLPSRLAAVGIVTDQNSELIRKFQNKFWGEDGLEQYVADPNQLVAEIKAILDNMQTVFFKPGITTETLAQDCVKTAVEHELQFIGYELKTDQERAINGELTKDYLQRVWGGWSEKLTKLHFSEPNYEKYRHFLTGRIERFLQSL